MPCSTSSIGLAANMSKPAPVNVIETPQQERALLVGYLVHNPLAGDLITGTGGVRKLRWALERRGKQGGARVVYYFHNEAMPTFALTAYAKNERADITQADRNEYRRLTGLLADRYARRKS